MTSYTNVFGGSPVQPSDVSYRAITLSANTTLQWPFSFQDTADVTARIMDVTPTLANLILTLPDATLTSIGEDFLISNINGGDDYSFVLNSNEGNTIQTLAQGTVYYLYLYDNTYAAGLWRVTPFAQGSTSVTSVNLSTGTASALTISGGPVTSSGSININASNDLVTLSNFGNNTGFAVRTSDTSEWQLRTLTNSDGNLTIQNPEGVIDNPIIDLNTDVAITTSLAVGNLSLSGTTLSASGSNALYLGNANGQIQLVGGASYGNITVNGSISVTPGTGGNLLLGSSTMTGYSVIYGAPVSSNPTYISTGYTNNSIRLQSASTGSYINLQGSGTLAGNVTISADNYVDFNTSTVQGINSLTATSGTVTTLSATNLTATTITSSQVAKAYGYISSAGGLIKGLNISTVSNTGTGTYLITLGYTSPDANYTIIATPQYGGTVGNTLLANPYTITTTSFNIVIVNVATTTAVNNNFYFAIFAPA